MAIRPRFVEVCCWGSPAAAEDVAGVAGRARRGNAERLLAWKHQKNQWPCNRNRLIGGTNPILIRPIYLLGLNFREHPHKIWPFTYGT